MEAEIEKTFLQILTEIPDQDKDIVKCDSDFITNFCNTLCSNKSIKGIMKIDDVVNKFETSLDMIDEMMKVTNLYNLLDSIFEKLQSDMDFNYFSFHLNRLQKESNKEETDVVSL